MPFPVVAAIAAGTQLATSGLNAASQTGTNKKQMKFAREMYDRQRSDALADYAMQNEYNSPVSQMKRFKEAGLNPNLIYGQGASMADASPIRSAQTGSYNPTAPRYDLGTAASAGIGAYYDSQVKQATVDNLKAANTQILADVALKNMQTAQVGANTANTLQNTKTSEYDLDYKKEIRASQISALSLANEQATKNIQQTMQATVSSRDANVRANELQPYNVANSISDLLTAESNRDTSKLTRDRMRVDIENAKKDGTLKDFDIKLREMGILPGDPWYYKAAKQLYDAVSPNAANSKAISTAAGEVLGKIRKAIGL